MKAPSVTVIITIWKRSYLAEQLTSLCSQNAIPIHILIVQNEQHVFIEDIIRTYRGRFLSLSYVVSSSNYKFFFRYSLALLCKTAYVFVLDDDVIPSAAWIGTCIEKCNTYNAIVSCTGRIIPKGDLYPEVVKDQDFREYFIGDCFNNEDFNFCPNDTYVDFGCNSYFLRTEWLVDFWSLAPSNLECGDDIHLSALAMIRSTIPTIVPQQLTLETSGNMKKLYGRDAVASWTKHGFFDVRAEILHNLIYNHGWRPLNW